jgi:ketosteroid isomerase-like protein
MNANETTIDNFYSAFQKRDFKTMQACYADNATFSDAVFRNLDATKVRAMWEMLCRTGKGLTIEYKNVKADENTGEAEWIANYNFSATGNKVENRIKANFTFKDGKIVTHTDHFDFYRWAKQAMGTTGLLLGWTPYLKNQVRTKAADNLQKFMDKNKNKG